MPDRPTRHVFVSYSSKDRKESPALVEQFFASIRVLRHSQDYALQLFIDDERLGGGDRWDEAIGRALNAADLAVLLVSTNFLDSDYIMQKELPLLHQRAQPDGIREGIRLIPVRLHPCAENTSQLLSGLQIRPRDRKALSELGPTELRHTLADLTAEVNRFLLPQPARHFEPARVAAPVTHHAPAAPAAAATDAPARLLAATLLRELGDDEAAALARRLVDGVALVTRLDGKELFRAVRFCIEFQLLVGEDPTSPTALQAFLKQPVTDEAARRLIDELALRSRQGTLSCAPIEVNSYFFSLTREREQLWKAYFDAVLEAGVDARERETLACLCPVLVNQGYLAPQHLVAGLLSRFNDDWGPVLRTYQRGIPDPEEHPGAFESLQASQWNCWLVWGPSIPICTCDQWRGAFAFQYGYGDENNSLPLVDLPDARGRPAPLLDPVAAAFDAEGRGAKFASLTARLRWGPWYLRAAGRGDTASRRGDKIDLERSDLIGRATASNRHPAAPAQANLYRENALQFRHDSDGITLQVETLEWAPGDHRIYFSAYLWMIFLVSCSDDEPGVGPRLLKGKAWPRWPQGPDQREQVRNARLWEHLLPVFVHANIGDAAALHFQKRVLAHNAVALLQQVWQRRAELFDERDLQAGLRFHLASASDYSGCGCPVRYPSGTPLVSLVRERLAAETDREFASSIVLPDNDRDPGRDAAARPRGLAGYFSSCHLPELVADYFDDVNRLNDRRSESS